MGTVIYSAPGGGGEYAGNQTKVQRVYQCKDMNYINGNLSEEGAFPGSRFMETRTNAAREHRVPVGKVPAAASFVTVPAGNCLHFQ